MENPPEHLLRGTPWCCSVDGRRLRGQAPECSASVQSRRIERCRPRTSPIMVRLHLVLRSPADSHGRRMCAKAAGKAVDELHMPAHGNGGRAGTSHGNGGLVHTCTTLGSPALSQAIPEGTPDQNPGWQIQLTLYDGAGGFGPDLQQLSITGTFETVHRARVKVVDATAERWEVPETLVPLPPLNTSLHLNDTHYDFSYTNQPFGFAITRACEGEVVWNSTVPAPTVPWQARCLSSKRSQLRGSVPRDQLRPASATGAVWIRREGVEPHHRDQGTVRGGKPSSPSAARCSGRS
jgi:hypothetical protein